LLEATAELALVQVLCVSKTLERVAALWLGDEWQ
jgi:hypothetical protein